MSKFRGDGDQIINFIYKSYFDSENMAMNNAFLHMPGYLFADITINSPGPNQLSIDTLGAIISPTNPRHPGELIRMHITSSFATSALVSGTDDFLIIRYTHVPNQDTTSASITTTTAAGITSDDVVVCQIVYTGANITSLNYHHSSVTKALSFTPYYKDYIYDDNGSTDYPEGYDTIFQHGNKTFSVVTSVSVTFPVTFGTALQTILVTPEVAADTQWRISASSTSGFTVTFDTSSTGKIFWEARGY